MVRELVIACLLKKVNLFIISIFKRKIWSNFMKYFGNFEENENKKNDLINNLTTNKIFKVKDGWNSKKYFF